jgi:TolB-like protein/DNA-binding winged helix-turn-helix (wHTH) protein/Tfp pilus assembly protein PilF
MDLTLSRFMDTSVQVYRFGPFESRPASRELYRHGWKLKVRPQPLQFLNVLLSHPGQVVTRESLSDQLWSSETFVDFELGLNTAVKELRAVLGDSALHPRYIQTLPKLGYRFIGLVDVIERPVSLIPDGYPQPGNAESLAAEESEFAEALEGAAETRSRRGPIALAATLALIVGLAAGGAFWLWSLHNQRSHRPAAAKIMLAVLPFENLTGDVSQEYFSDGLTEEMIAQLSHSDPQRLGVIARTSVMHYKHAQQPMDQIGRALGVEYLLEGSVRRDADKIRITAQLFRAQDQSHIWSHQYDREPNNLLSLQGEIAQEISEAIQLTIGDHRSPRTAFAAASSAPKSYEAYDLYLQGRYLWNKRTLDGFQRSVDCYEKAIVKDPTYARAYAGLADSYTLMAAYYFAPQSELIPKARTAALKALELDGNLAEAHASLAVMARNYDWDWETAEKEFRRTLALDPNYATGHHWYSEDLAFRGLFDESFEEFERARQLDPLSLIIQADHAVSLYYARQYDRAIAQFRAVGAVEPDFNRVHMVALAYAQQGRFSEALADVAAWPHLKDSDLVWIWCERAYIFGRAGRRDEAQRDLDELLRYNRHHRLDPMIYVTPYVGVGDKDQAFAWLEKSIAVHSPGLVALKVDPVFDPIRSDPRFEAVLRRVGRGN